MLPLLQLAPLLSTAHPWLKAQKRALCHCSLEGAMLPAHTEECFMAACTQAVRANDSKEIVFDANSRRRLQAGINKVADAVAVTLGPRGESVAAALMRAMQLILLSCSTLACTNTHTRAHMRTHARTNLSTHTHTRMHVCAFVHKHTYTHADTHRHMCAHTHARTNAHAYVQTYANTYVLTYTHVGMFLYALTAHTCTRTHTHVLTRLSLESSQ
jgi:hypothetical protein